MPEATQTQRYRGCLLGLATGDALGTTLEFEPPNSFTPIDAMVGGGPFQLRPGEWTDDTSMALCLAESLVEKSGFDPVDQLERYVRWYREGHMSSTGICFDIGNTTSAALERFEGTGDPYSGSQEPLAAGNGSIMRLAPVPMFYSNSAIEIAAARSGESSRTTHGARDCVDACRFFGTLIAHALRGVDKEALLSEEMVGGDYWEKEPLSPNIAEVASGSYKRKDPPEIRGTGHVVASLEAALWAFHRSESFEEGVLMAVNLGDDADTTGAVYGQLGGAYYGEVGIRASWKRILAHRLLLHHFAERLLDLDPHDTDI